MTDGAGMRHVLARRQDRGMAPAARPPDRHGRARRPGLGGAARRLPVVPARRRAARPGRPSTPPTPARWRWRSVRRGRCRGVAVAALLVRDGPSPLLLLTGALAAGHRRRDRGRLGAAAHPARRGVRRRGRPAARPRRTGCARRRGRRAPPARRRSSLQALLGSSHGRPRSPPASTSSRSCTAARSPTPTAGSRTPPSRQTREWSAAQDRLARDHLDALPGRERLAAAARASCWRPARSARPPGARGRPFWTRRAPGQEHAVLLDARRRRHRAGAARPGGARPVRPDDARRLVAVEGGHAAGLPALVRRRRGVAAARARRRDRRAARRSRRPLPLLPRRVGARRRGVLLRPPAAARRRCPTGEESFHRRVSGTSSARRPTQDVLVWGEGLDPTNYYGCSVSPDGRWLLVTASAGTAPREDVWLFDLDGRHAAGRGAGRRRRPLLAVGLARRRPVAAHRPRRAARPAVPAPTRRRRTDWTTVVPEDPEAVLEDVELLDDGAARAAAQPARAVARCRCAHGTARSARVAAARRRAPSAGLSAEPEGGSRVWFGSTSATAPSQVHELDAAHRRAARCGPTRPGAVALGDVVATVRRDDVRRRHDRALPGAVAVRRAGPAAARRCSTATAASASRSPPAGTRRRLAWVEAGGVWVVANLRGGSEEGEAWHRAGMREHKQDVFDDFAAVADALVADGWTTPAQLGISGGSNGGLLVGAALTQRPQAYAAVVCSAPLLDMVRYELFGLGPDLERRVRHRRRPGGARLAARLLALPPRRRRDRLPGGAVHRLRRRQPRRPAARPQAVRGAAGRHDVGRARCCCAPRPTSATAPARSRARSGWPSTCWPSWPRTPAWRSADVPEGDPPAGGRGAAAGPVARRRGRRRRPRLVRRRPRLARSAAGSTGSVGGPGARRRAARPRPPRAGRPGRLLAGRGGRSRAGACGCAPRCACPASAELELAVEPEGDGRAVLVQRTRFTPSGSAGHAYWWAVAPLHGRGVRAPARRPGAGGRAAHQRRAEADLAWRP